VIRILFVLIFALPTIASAQWSGNWQSKGSDALIGLSSEPSNLDIAKNTYLIIGYTRQFSCTPVVSVLIIKGQRLGNPITQKKSQAQKNQLVLTVNGKVFSGETRLNEYTNGMELAMPGSLALVSELSTQNTSIDVTVGSTRIMNFSKANGFATANSYAKSNCR